MTTKQITVLEQQVTPVVSQAQLLSITSTEQLTSASELRENIKRVQKDIEADKEELYRPAKMVLDEINSRYAPFEKPLKEALKIVNDKMSTYQTQVLRAQQEAEAKIAARVKEGKGNLSASSAMAKMEALEAPVELDLTGFAKKEVLVITDESLIPREFMMPNENAITLALKAGRTISGATLETKLIPRSK